LKVIKAIIITIMPDLSSVVPAPRFTATMGHFLMEIGNPGEIFFQKSSGQNPPWGSHRRASSFGLATRLEELLQMKFEKDLPDMRSDGVEFIYWMGTESGLMGIYNFPGFIYATDGSKGSIGMGAHIPPSQGQTRASSTDAP